MPSTLGSPDRSGPPAGDWIDPAIELVAWGRRLGRALAGGAKEQGLSETQFQLLWLLGTLAEPLSSQAELARELALSPAQVSGLLEELRSRGLVTGRSAKSDRRRRLWRLTPAGFARRFAVAARLAQKITPAERSFTEAAAGLLRSQADRSPVRLRPFVAEPGEPDKAPGADPPLPPAAGRKGGRS